MNPPEWHVDAQLWRAYTDGALDEVIEASIDAHVVECASCRAAASEQVQDVELAALWERVRDEVRSPRVPWTARWLRRIGVADGDLVVVGAADGIAAAWALAVGGALLCALLSGAVPTRQDETFLLIAPLVPVAAVVASFHATDRLRTLTAVTPFSQLRLTLLRTIATLTVALPATLAVGLGIPGLESLAFVWLLPSLALTSATLVLLSSYRPATASGVVAAAWTSVVVASAGADRLAVLTEARVQLIFLVALLGLGGLLMVRTSENHMSTGQL